MLLGRVPRTATGEAREKSQGSRESRSQEVKVLTWRKENLRGDIAETGLWAEYGLKCLSQPVIFSLVISLLDSTY